MNKFYKYLIFCGLLFGSFTGFSQVMVMQDFDTISMPQAGWSSPTLPNFTTTSTRACDGKSARGPLNSNSTAPELVYMSQEATGDDIIISFDYKILEKSSGAATDEDFGSFAIQYSADDGHTWLNYRIINDASHTPSTSCKTVVDTISGADVPNGSDFGWRVKGQWNKGDNYIYIDDFEAVEDVSCKQPYDIQVGKITFDEIKLSWTEYNSPGASQWEVAFCPEGIDPNNPGCYLNNIITANSNPYTIQNLNEGTTYDIFVRSVCDSTNNDKSAWSGPVRVQTVAIGTDCDSPIEITSLPYSHSSDTEKYDNIYDKAPGGPSCGTTQDFLEGYDVVYKYTSPNDDIIDIKLSGNLDGDVGVFVYESCNDIGNACFAGAVTSNGDDFGITDLYVDSGTDYYIVVSSKGVNSHTEYTLDITGFECATFDPPAGDQSYDFYGQTLADYTNTRVGVNVTIQGADLIWYSDANLTNEITDPSSINLSDNDEFWAIQEVMGCTSADLHVTFHEFDCDDLEVNSTSSDGTICDEGQTTLRASANSDNLIWYDSEVGGNVVGMGKTFTTPEITETTSYWVGEFFRGEGNLSGQANVGPVAGTDFNDPAGLEFELSEAIVLKDVQIYVTGSSDDLTIQLINDNGGVQEKTVSVMGGSAAFPNPVTVPLDFEITDPSAGPFHLVMTSGPSMLGTNSSDANFPYPIGNSGQVTGGITGTSSSSGTYYYFYNWTISASIALCESDREEVKAVVNETIPITIEPDAYSVCVGSKADLKAQSDDQDYEYTWTWVDVNGTSQSVQADSIEPVIDQGTTFTLSAINPNTGCSTEEDIFIDAVGVGEIPVYPTSVNACAGDVIALQAGEINYDFENAIINWTFINNSQAAPGADATKAGWKKVNSPFKNAENAESPDKSSFMITMSDPLGPKSTVETAMVSPSINLVGVRSAKLEFYQYYKYISTQSTSAQVLISDDGGNTWHAEASYTSNQGEANDFKKESIDLEDYLGKANVRIAFSYTGNWGWWWAVDDVSIVQTYSNGQVTWDDNGQNSLYMDEDMTVSYQGQPVNQVFFSADSTGTYDLDVELYVEGCSDPVTSTVSVQVNNVNPPTGPSEQEFNAGSHVSDIEVQGTGLRYYILKDGDYVRQSINADIIDGETYYISQRSGDCISGFLEVHATYVCTAPTDLTIQSVDLSSDGATASAIIFWTNPDNLDGIDGYEVIVKDDTDQVWTDDVVSKSNNYLIVSGLPLQTEFSVELFTVCDAQNDIFSDSELDTFNTKDLEIDDFNKDVNFTYYPNPVNHQLTINSDLPMNKISIMDLRGRLVKEFFNVGKETELDLSDLSAGNYFLTVRIGSHQQVVKLVKK